jgi:hypothetical protein
MLAKVNIREWRKMQYIIMKFCAEDLDCRFQVIAACSILSDPTGAQYRLAGTIRVSSAE